MIQSVDDGNFSQQKVLIRVDFNVPIGDDFRITDHTRIDESLKTIDKVIDDGGIPVLMSHLGRPKGVRNLKYSLRPVADYFNNVLGYHCIFATDCIGEKAKEAIDSATIGDIVLLENLRFYKQEEKNEAYFARSLSELGDAYINDAFGTAHRAHASTHSIASFFDDRYAGYLLESEINYLEKAVNNPQRPFIAIIGGAKITGKIDVIKNLMNKCDKILIGGGMMYTFFKALGYKIGHSIIEESKIKLAHEIIEMAERRSLSLMLPSDTVVADSFSNDANFKNVSITGIPDDMAGLDIGSATIKTFQEEILKAKTIVWNGPMGVFELDNFAKGTYAIARALAKATEKGAVTIVGGGDSASAITQMGLEKSVSHVSTGGGASLEYLEGKTLPGIAALNK